MKDTRTRRQQATDSAVKILENVESIFRAQDNPLDDRDYLGLRILKRVIDYLRDPNGWMRGRERFRTPTARFWEDR